MNNRYDYIIAGAGCAGLSLAVRMALGGMLNDKRLLIVEPGKKTLNDRTWCFWEREDGFFESIVYHRWAKAWVHGERISKLLDLDPYQYKMIRGIDFYDHCKKILNEYPGIDRLHMAVDNISTTVDGAVIEAGSQQYSGSVVFSSLPPDLSELKPRVHLLQQHFCGWVIETGEPVFDPGCATLMDFRVPQHSGTGFVYTMPFTATSALVEYTVISKGLLEVADYTSVLKKYIREICGVRAYVVNTRELGAIPMTSHRFPQRNGNVIYIGTAGGQTKPSSGYTFMFIQKRTAEIVRSLQNSGHPFGITENSHSARFRWYDKVLLNILVKKTVRGSEIFQDLFSKNQPAKILRFLDNETSFSEELKIMRSVPALPFIRAGVEEMF